LGEGLKEQGPIEELQDRFARIEAAVDDGDTDLGRLGFHRLLRTVKVDPMLAAHWADVAGRIDRKAFERRVRFRVPVALGNAILFVGTLVGAGAIVLAISTEDEVLAGLALIASAGILSVTVHDLAHWLVGRIGGIRFQSYYLDGPFRIQPGLKIDYASYLRAGPGDRAVMHAAGALASKAAPFVSLAFSPATDAPSWAFWIVLGIGVVQIASDIVWSTRKGDWKKVRRERGLARAAYGLRR
jgi:hypothetical protein